MQDRNDDWGLMVNLNGVIREASDALLNLGRELPISENNNDCINAHLEMMVDNYFVNIKRHLKRRQKEYKGKCR